MTKKKHQRYPDEKIYLDYFQGVIKWMNQGFAKTPCPRAFAINFRNYESGGHFSYDASSLSHFCKYLEKTYGDITRLNFTWGTDYKTFTEAQPPRWAKGDKKNHT